MRLAPHRYTAAQLRPTWAAALSLRTFNRKAKNSSGKPRSSLVEPRCWGEPRSAQPTRNPQKRTRRGGGSVEPLALVRAAPGARQHPVIHGVHIIAVGVAGESTGLRARIVVVEASGPRRAAEGLARGPRRQPRRLKRGLPTLGPPSTTLRLRALQCGARRRAVCVHQAAVVGLGSKVLRGGSRARRR